MEYNVTFSDPDTNTVTYSAPYSTCHKDTCNETDITPSSLSRICPSSTITVSADYGLGQRLLFDPITIGMFTNQHRIIKISPNYRDLIGKDETSYLQVGWCLIC